MELASMVSQLHSHPTTSLKTTNRPSKTSGANVDVGHTVCPHIFPSVQRVKAPPPAVHVLYAPTRQPQYVCPQRIPLTAAEPICEEIMRSTDHVRVINWLHCADYAAPVVNAPMMQPCMPHPLPPIQQPLQSPAWPARSVSLVYRGDDASVVSDSSDDDGGATHWLPCAPHPTHPSYHHHTQHCPPQVV